MDQRLADHRGRVAQGDGAGAADRRRSQPAAGRQRLASAQCAGRDGARITIETAGDSEDVTVKIVDNGPGIPSEVLPRIWDPFFTTKDVGEGTGLGLSIVHELVTRHGGTINADTKLGEGTTFTVKLPRQIPAALRKPRATDSKRIATQS